MKEVKIFRNTKEMRQYFRGELNAIEPIEVCENNSDCEKSQNKKCIKNKKSAKKGSGDK